MRSGSRMSTDGATSSTGLGACFSAGLDAGVGVSLDMGLGAGLGMLMSDGSSGAMIGPRARCGLANSGSRTALAAARRRCIAVGGIGLEAERPEPRIQHPSHFAFLPDASAAPDADAGLADVGRQGVRVAAAAGSIRG